MDRVREIVISRKEVLDLFVWWYNTNDNLLYKYENGWELVIGKASQTQDGLMSKEDKILLDTYTGVASATTIAGYGITDAYTKTEVDTFIDNLGAASMIEESVESYETFDDFPLPAYAKEDTIYIDLTTNLIYYWAEDSLEYVLITNKDNVIYISNPNDILEIPNLDSEVTEGLYKVKHVKGTEVLNYTLNIKRAGTTITQVLQSFEFYATRKKYGSWLVWEKFEYAYTQNLVEFSIPPVTSETKINLGIKDNKYYRYKFTVNNLNLVYTADSCKQGSIIEFTTSADFTPDKFSWTNGFTDSTQTVPLFTDLYGEPIGPNTKVIIFYQRNVMLIRLKGNHTHSDLITASETVHYFGDTYPESALPGQRFLNTADGQIYLWDTGQDGLSPGSWAHNDQSLPTTVYLCDSSLNPNTTDLSSYSIIIKNPNDWYILAKSTASSTNKSYTLDFQLSSELVQDVNILGEITIKKVIAKNCANVYLSYGTTIRLDVTLNSDIALVIPDGELLTWEIVRTTDNALASVGVLITV